MKRRFGEARRPARSITMAANKHCGFQTGRIVGSKIPQRRVQKGFNSAHLSRPDSETSEREKDLRAPTNNPFKKRSIRKSDWSLTPSRIHFDLITYAGEPETYLTAGGQQRRPFGIHDSVSTELRGSRR
jgi:hypothetical protein